MGAKERGGETVSLDENVPEDVYELQIIEAQYKADVPAHKLNKNQTPADEVVFVCEVLGTKNPDFEDAPYKVWLFGARDMGKMTYTSKEGKPEVSKAGRILMGLGFDRDTVAAAKFKEVGWKATEGLFLRGPLFHKSEKFLGIDAKALLPVKNADHITRNQSRKADIFPGLAA